MERWTDNMLDELFASIRETQTLVASNTQAIEALANSLPIIREDTEELKQRMDRTYAIAESNARKSQALADFFAELAEERRQAAQERQQTAQERQQTAQKRQQLF